MQYSAITDSLRLLNDEIGSGNSFERFSKFILRQTGFDQCAIYFFQKDNKTFKLRGAAGGKKSFDEVLPVGSAPVNLKSGKRRIFDISGDIPEAEKKSFKGAFVCSIHDKTNPGFIFLRSKKKQRISAKIEKALVLISLEILVIERMFARLAGYEKIMALGDMAATLVHELKNPILSIGGYAVRLRHHLKDGPEPEKYLTALTTEAKRLEELTGGMINFLREERVELKPNDLNSIIAETISFLKNEFTSRAIDLRLVLQKGGIPILADSIQLKIAFDNIIANSIQSMETGGILTIATRSSDTLAEVSFTDTGGGIDPSHISSIFNPLFTTKKRGTGLGLPIVSSIVNRHNGTISVDNKVGVGVSFTFRFTRQNGAAAARKN